MGINEKLLSIYRDRWTSLGENLRKLEPSKYANPFILSFDNAKYESADIRVMIFGQETKGWLNKDGLLETVDEASLSYHSFFCWGCQRKNRPSARQRLQFHMRICIIDT